MKRILILLAPLSCLAMFLPSTPAQDRGTRVRVEVDVPPAPRAAYVAAPPVYAEPPPVYAGTGCRGYAAGGCRSAQAGGCIGRAAPVMYVPVATGGGCQSRTAGCYGGGPAYGAGMYASEYGAVPYGSRLPNGRYATPTRLPEPPRLIPSNGPITRTARLLFGFDPNY